MLRCLLWAIAAAVRPKILLIADKLCLRQQLLVLKRQKPRPTSKRLMPSNIINGMGFRNQFCALQPSYAPSRGTPRKSARSHFRPTACACFRVVGIRR
jgi:hypothetical protein